MAHITGGNYEAVHQYIIVIIHPLVILVQFWNKFI